MPLTLLLDLDDTLLRNNIEDFLPAYLKLLSQHLEHRYPGDHMVRELLSATRRMIMNQDSTSTLEEVFDRAFYPALGTTKEEIRPDLEDFYARVYPGLAQITNAQPHAVSLVDTARACGYRIVVATNPLFPATAIEQRLTWAGLPPENYPFALITNYENMHFAKPNPAYTAEILAYLGWPAKPAVMVGNSLEDDLLPASQIGLVTYHFIPNQAFTLSDHPVCAASGDFSGLADWLKQVEATTFNLPRTPEALIPALRATPAALLSLTRGLSENRWRYSPAPEAWSVTEVIAHLRDVDAEVNLPRLHRVLEQNNPFLPGVNSDPWAVERGYAQQDGHKALRDLADSRARIIALLEGLAPQDWKRPARHAIFGPSQLIDLVEIIFTHDRTHLQQVRENLLAFKNSAHSQSA